MFEQILIIGFKLLGALALFMYGMQLSSDGIQRAAGDRLQKTVNFMTRNRFVALSTGFILTVLIQSSSGTSVMVVSFVNAGLLNLAQAVGVMMGAHIGTTMTGWIIAAVGIDKFSLALIAIPIFGIGYLMSLMKKRGNSFVSYGEALMGFALIFMGLDFMADAIPNPSDAMLLKLREFQSLGYLATVVCVFVGIVFTMLINASSATIAIVIGMAAKGLLTWDISAALVLGANVGTTFDAFLVSLGANTKAKRAAWGHILINVLGVVVVMAFFKPFITLVDWIVPGEITPKTIGVHIAMSHTIFNVTTTLLFLPLLPWYVRFLEWLIKPKASELAASKLVYKEPTLLPTPELNILQAKSDIKSIAASTEACFVRLRSAFIQEEVITEEDFEELALRVKFIATTREGTAKFLIDIAQQDITEKTRDNITILIRLCTDFDNISKCCENLSFLLEKSYRKNLKLDKDERWQLDPYTQLVLEFLRFVTANLDKPLSSADLALATEFEDRIDAFRSDLKKMSRKRLRAGADVKVELYFIDVIRYIERIGDYSYSIASSMKDYQ